MIIDTHTHLFEDVYSCDRDLIFQSLKKDNLETIIIVGYNLESSIKAVNLAKKYNCYALIGFHPDYAEFYNDKVEAELESLAKEKCVVGIGEIGLDYHHISYDKNLQADVFLKQLKLANKLSLPISIHLRDADLDMEKLLQDNKNLLTNGGVMHCFSGDTTSAEFYLNLGFYIAFGGVLTFKNAKKTVDVAKLIPMDKILLETDCPFLAPAPFRSKRNEPKLCNIVAQKLSEVRELPLNVVEEQTLKNSHNLFKKMEIKNEL